MSILPIILFVLLSLSSFDITHAATQCYSCSPCGGTWDPSAATIIQTANPNDYCRKAVTGSLVVKDSASSCSEINFANNGVFCCQTDLCNTAYKLSSTKTVIFIFLMISFWIISFKRY